MSWWLLAVIALCLGVAVVHFSRRKKSDRPPVAATPAERPKAAGDLVSIEVRQPSDLELRVRDLSAMATEVKKTDLGLAIEHLQEAQRIARESGLQQTTEWWLRLPLFLQAAGRTEESDAEFGRQLLDAKARVARHFSHLSGTQSEMPWHSAASTIYEKWALACRRAGREDRAAELFQLHQTHHDQWRVIYDEFMAEQPKPRKRAEWRKPTGDHNA